jgi:ribosomal protein S18 acetylase RimI-like enzyme
VSTPLEDQATAGGDAGGPDDATVLENPVFHALCGPQAALAERHGSAVRFRPAVGPFGGLPDRPSAADWEDLAALVGRGGTASLFRRPLAPPPGWEEVFRRPCLQMVGPAPGTAFEAPEVGQPLGPADASEMLDLVARTRPGPFGPETVLLGGYVGVRRGGRLVAMAGTRIQPGGFAELSAVCTDDEHRGQGLGTALVRQVTAAVLASGRTPFLHVADTNEAAIRLYLALGFTTRSDPVVQGLRPPEGPGDGRRAQPEP